LLDFAQQLVDVPDARQGIVQLVAVCRLPLEEGDMRLGILDILARDIGSL
jgi:hypothetical protein